MNKAFFLFFALISLLSCDLQNSSRAVDKSIFIHDRSSKVWLVDKKMQGNKDYTPLRFEYKELVVFHDSGVACFYKMQDFGKQPGYKMNFEINNERNKLTLANKKMTRVFTIRSIGRKRLVLESKAESYPYTLILIPFPEY